MNKCKNDCLLCLNLYSDATVVSFEFFGFVNIALEAAVAANIPDIIIKPKI